MGRSYRASACPNRTNPIAESGPRGGSGVDQGPRALVRWLGGAHDDGMTTQTTPWPDRLDGDDLVEPEPHLDLPDHLDRPLEVPEADALEQQLDVPVDDDEH